MNTRRQSQKPRHAILSRGDGRGGRNGQLPSQISDEGRLAFRQDMQNQSYNVKRLLVGPARAPVVLWKKRMKGAPVHGIGTR